MGVLPVFLVFVFEFSPTRRSILVLVEHFRPGVLQELVYLVDVGHDVFGFGVSNGGGSHPLAVSEVFKDVADGGLPLGIDVSFVFREVILTSKLRFFSGTRDDSVHSVIEGFNGEGVGVSLAMYVLSFFVIKVVLGIVGDLLDVPIDQIVSKLLADVLPFGLKGFFGVLFVYALDHLFEAFGFAEVLVGDGGLGGFSALNEVAIFFSYGFF